jgi:hypothetical protein
MNRQRGNRAVRWAGLVAGLWLCWSLSASAQTGAMGNSPAELVKKYLSLDSKGVRLDDTSFDALAPYVTWRQEPLWGRIVVVQGFTVPDDLRRWEIVSMLEVVIPVEFSVLGAVYMETGSFVREPTTEQVRFRLKVFNNRWKITEPVLPPHVGQKRMINFIKQSLLEEKDPTRRETLALLQADLTKAK